MVSRPHDRGDRQGEGDAVWHSNRRVTENVKQIRKAAKKQDRAGRRPPEAEAKRSRARSSRRPRYCASSRRRAPCPPSSRRSWRRRTTRRRRREWRPRGEVRRLPHAGAARPRQGQAADAQGSRLDGTSFNPIADAVAQLDADQRADRRRNRGRGRTASATSPPCRMRSSTTRLTASSTTCSTCCISMASI